MHAETETEKNHITECLLDDGTITTYDLCGDDRNTYTECGNLKLVYLGCGVIYSLDGKLQNFTYKKHFFRKIGF